MPKTPRAVFFDIDGVLIDSLPEHLRICHDKAMEYGLALDIPDAAGFRNLVRSGTKVSPMRDFFLAVGFPVKFAEQAVIDYERDFMTHYRPTKFAGVDQALEAIKSHGVELGLVTSNVRDNVVPALGAAMQFFSPGCTFFFDDSPVPRTKASCLIDGAQKLGLDQLACVYVGDQPVDADAAQAANFQFLGITYGWGISADDQGYPTVSALSDLPAAILQMDETARH